MRMDVLGMKPPFTMIGVGVYKIRESRDSNYPKGATVIANAGWVQTGIFNTKAMKIMDRSSLRVAPAGDIDIRMVPNDFTMGLSESHLLGACGSVGLTAYFGLLDLCQPKPGETVVVNGAAGAVGSLVGQIAKLKGCFVIGFAGSDKKCEFLTKELGFDKAYNEKTPPMIPSIQGSMVGKQLKMEGFIVSRWASCWNEGLTQMAKWVDEGKIKTQ